LIGRTWNSKSEIDWCGEAVGYFQMGGSWVVHIDIDIDTIHDTFKVLISIDLGKYLDG